jgi:hypothetical protein
MSIHSPDHQPPEYKLSTTLPQLELGLHPKREIYKQSIAPAAHLLFSFRTPTLLQTLSCPELSQWITHTSPQPRNRTSS